jgi:outer membrane autotransporter protein
MVLADEFVELQMEHLGGVSPLALGGSDPETGMSAGDQPNPYTMWLKGFGRYAHQDPRGASQGYRLSNGGAAFGVEKELSEEFRAGVALGASRSWMRSQANAGRTDIDSWQLSWHGGFKPVSSPLYVNGALTYMYNEYEGSREIRVGGLPLRSASAGYHAHLFGTTVEAGYAVPFLRAVFTPLASLSYNRLNVGSYEESGAGALNLRVDSQGYDRLRLGFGGKMEHDLKFSLGTLTSEVHARYLYDPISDAAEISCSFSGGGTAFAVAGNGPAKSGANLGGSLKLAAKKNTFVSVVYDTELRDGYYSHAGSLNAGLKF